MSIGTCSLRRNLPIHVKEKKVQVGAAMRREDQEKAKRYVQEMRLKIERQSVERISETKMNAQLMIK